MSLNKQLSAFKVQLYEQLPAERRDAIDGVTEELEKFGVEENVLKEGDILPSFALPDVSGNTVNSEELLARGPLIISFYRGGWCPYCSLELKALQEILPEIKDLGASLIAITPETPDNSLTTIQKNELTFEVLSDVGNKVAKLFGVGYDLSDKAKQMFDLIGLDLTTFNGNAKLRLPLPGTFVVNANGKVIKSFAAADHTQRLEPSEVLAALREATVAA